MILVNFAAGPGAGKSTTSAYVFSRLKMAYIKAELVGEEAKDVTYNQAYKLLDNQIYLLGQQYQRTKRLDEAGCDVAICDSPFVLNALYCQGKPYAKEILALVRRLEKMYPHTINIFVDRVKPYMTMGRNQTYAEAKALDDRARRLFKPIHLSVYGNEDGAYQAYQFVRKAVEAGTHES